MEKMQSLLSDPESMQQLQELAQMLQADSGQESTETESAPTATEQTDAAASGGGLDLGALMKVSKSCVFPSKNPYPATACFTIIYLHFCWDLVHC